MGEMQSLLCTPKTVMMLGVKHTLILMFILGCFSILIRINKNAVMNTTGLKYMVNLKVTLW